MAANNPAKGDLGDQAVAWAFCRFAWLDETLGESLQRVLPNSKIAKALFKLKFRTKMIAGAAEHFGATNLSVGLCTGNYVFPPPEAGPDGMVELIHVKDDEVLPDSQAEVDEEVLPDSQTEPEAAYEKNKVDGLLSVQSKVRTSFDILDAICTTNPYLIYTAKEDRKGLMATGSKGHFNPSEWTLRQTHINARNDLIGYIGDVGCIVRVLFSAGGFPEIVVQNVDSWNDAHPEAPIVLLYPTPQLFGGSLSQSLNNLAKLTEIGGKTMISDYLAIKKLDNTVFKQP